MWGSLWVLADWLNSIRALTLTGLLGDLKTEAEQKKG